MTNSENSDLASLQEFQNEFYQKGSDPYQLEKLLNEFNGEYEKFPVVESTFSQRARRGIASVPPMDANSQDVSVLIGSEDISKLDKYPEDDPRVLSLNGAFNVGKNNRPNNIFA